MLICSLRDKQIEHGDYYYTEVWVKLSKTEI